MPLELVILIGLQASGKSTFAHSKYADYVQVSKDAIPNVKNKNKRQEQLIHKALGMGNNVVVDNTNPSKVDRAKLIQIGRDYNTHIIGYYFSSQVNKCIERNRNRDGKACVPDVAFYTTLHKLELPTYDEGFGQLYYVEINSERGDFMIRDWWTISAGVNQMLPDVLLMAGVTGHCVKRDAVSKRQLKCLNAKLRIISKNCYLITESTSMIYQTGSAEESDLIKKR